MEWLKVKALSSNPSTTKKKKGYKGKEPVVVWLWSNCVPPKCPCVKILISSRAVLLGDGRTLRGRT
jgi:hypothetical protein